jgi:ribulose 1,5-bisphosphate synthetase/thiazole synthase
MLLIALLVWSVSAQSKRVDRNFDLVIYGGTAGGVMTAVAAAREGLQVAIVEPGRHLGGMVTGGLSRTDFGKREVLGGLAVEFYQRAGNKYGCRNRASPSRSSMR